MAAVAVGSVLTLFVAACAAEPSSSDAEDDPAEVATVAEEITATDQPQAVEDATPDQSEDGHSDDGDDHEEGEETFAFGEPADPSEADRTVTIVASDDMAYDPPTVEVSAGEVITFEVENVGQLPHDFTIGDEAAQQEHAAEMAEMSADEAHADPNTITLAAGETGSLTWRFTEDGEFLYGCHQPGHYDAGMVGTMTVTS